MHWEIGLDISICCNCVQYAFPLIFSMGSVYIGTAVHACAWVLGCGFL